MDEIRKERLTNLKWGDQTMHLKVLPIPEANSATFRSTEPNLSMQHSLWRQREGVKLTSINEKL